MEKIKPYERRFEEETRLDFNKYVKPIKANYRGASPYGIITPSFLLILKNRRIFLPKNHKDFIDLLNERQPKNPKELDDLEIEFIKFHKK